MTRYLSGVSGYYGCVWKDMCSENNYDKKSGFHFDNKKNRKTQRIHSFLDYMYEKDATDFSPGEGYSPSVVRKARAMTVPPLQDIYEDTMFYPSKWVSPSLSRKDRRERLQNQKNKKDSQNIQKNKFTSDYLSNEGKQINPFSTTYKNKTTEWKTKKNCVQELRKNFSIHKLGSLPEDKIARSFDEGLENCFDNNALNSLSLDSPSLRPRSWSH